MFPGANSGPFAGMGEKMADAARSKLDAQKSTFMGGQPTAFGGMFNFKPKQKNQTFMGSDNTTSDVWR